MLKERASQSPPLAPSTPTPSPLQETGEGNLQVMTASLSIASMNIRGVWDDKYTDEPPWLTSSNLLSYVSKNPEIQGAAAVCAARQLHPIYHLHFQKTQFLTHRETTGRQSRPSS